MDKLLTIDNLAIVVLALWVVELKRTNIALTKSNETAWNKVGRMTEALYKIAGRLSLNVTGSFYADDLTKN